MPAGSLGRFSIIEREERESMRNLQKIGVLIILVSFASTLVYGQKDVVKKVVFKKGKTTAAYFGKLPKKYADYDAYLVRGRKGQTLTVKLNGDEWGAHIRIFETKLLGPTEDALIEGEEPVEEWSGKLPVTSEYSVQVYGVRSFDDGAGKGADYAIDISLK